MSKRVGVENKPIIGQFIIKKLENANETQEWLAEQCGVTRGQINHIVCGRSNPSLPLLFRICKILDIDVNLLF